MNCGTNYPSLVFNRGSTPSQLTNLKLKTAAVETRPSGSTQEARRFLRLRYTKNFLERTKEVTMQLVGLHDCKQ